MSWGLRFLAAGCGITQVKRLVSPSSGDDGLLLGGTTLAGRGEESYWRERPRR
jgi:hypothetical protein